MAIELNMSKCLALNARANRFGIISGEITTLEDIPVGTSITLPYACYVSGRTFDEATGIYTLSVSDPATAILAEVLIGPTDGGIEEFYLADTMFSVLERTGFSVSYGGVFFGRGYPPESEVNWKDLVRIVLLSSGGVLLFNGTGWGAFPSSDSQVEIDDGWVLSATVEDDPGGYANVVTVSVHDEWVQTQGLSSTSGEEELGGLTISWEATGDQMTFRKEEDSESGIDQTERWEYDDYGYCTKYTKIVLSPDNEDPNKQEREETEILFSVSSDNVYSYTKRVVLSRWDWWVDDPEDDVLQWGLSQKRIEETSGSVNLAGYSEVTTTIQEEEKTKSPLQRPMVNVSKTRTRVYRSVKEGVLPDERVVSDHWKWDWYVVNRAQDIAWRWVPDGGATVGGASVEPLIKAPPQKIHSVHLEATAKDSESISALGEIRKEISVVGIADMETLKRYARGELAECSRIRKARLEISMGQGAPDYSTCPGYEVHWRNRKWWVSAVEVRLPENTMFVELETEPRLEETKKALLGVPKVAEAVIDLIKKHGRTTTNVDRGKVAGLISQGRYLVDLGGGRKVRAERGLASGRDNIPVGATVLLARPSGREITWTILERPQEAAVSFGSVERTPRDPSLEVELGPLNITPRGDPQCYPMVVDLDWEVKRGASKILGYVLVVSGFRLGYNVPDDAIAEGENPPPVGDPVEIPIEKIDDPSHPVLRGVVLTGAHKVLVSPLVDGWALSTEVGGSAEPEDPGGGLIG
ncbi:hypothetical protein L2W58_08030 [Dethiosulfovibrio sp. F2B]|uniref:hypothetical protein n=1 Tax=Dethiosulfovibrio faecalis TaxID=2720018 RepID=UPI001F2CE74E|nr:hypothetical protein [Dethiosulfovibrio faecalis]MCF4151749.1 hypothetical protein [Dethiosulfovibrio faecalis]